MSYRSKLGLVALVIASGSSYAISPTNGWYASALVGASFAPSVDFYVNSPFRGVPTPGRISYDIFMDAGAELGFRCSNFRFAGEFLFNQNDYDRVTFGNGRIQNNSNRNTGLSMKGKTSFYGGFANAYYDFFDDESESNFSPYIGLGIGYAYVENSLSYYFNQFELNSLHDSINDTVIAGQAIVGLNYLMNEDWALGTDLRYIRTAKVDILGENIAFLNVNLNLTYTFDNA